MSDRRMRSARAGFVLPFVVVTLLLVAALAGATTFAAWRSVRSARLGFNGERAVQGADEGLVAAMAAWDADAFATRAIGARWQATLPTADAGAVTLSYVRTAPLVAVLSARMESRVRGSPDTARRAVTRHVALEAPGFPLQAALSALGPLTLQGDAVFDGRDTSAPADGCGALRDTLSVAGVRASPPALDATVTLEGAPPLLTSGAASENAARVSFDSAWRVSFPRITRIERPGIGASLSSQPEWTARVILAPDSVTPAPPQPAATPRTVTLGGTSTHTGLVLVDGDLTLTGSLTVNGALLVRGALDARGGTLVVNGAVVIRDEAARESVLGTGARVRYSPCAVGRALATIAKVRTNPFATWIER